MPVPPVQAPNPLDGRAFRPPFPFPDSGAIGVATTPAPQACLRARIVISAKETAYGEEPNR